MARFYVGQRVRIVKCNRFQEFLGHECTVAALNAKGRHANTGEFFVGIELDLKHPISDCNCVVYNWQIEPITDSNSLVNWADCLWRPEHLRNEVSA